ncbi:MAG: alpha,alpha-trehalose-phosphate synthase (UDP-forming) [Hyphomicrobiales bacterium]|nr:alpha,alpha-trehalose-phosphate synthase (UDP-forming) [Hyphomicrobiales bacterium]
MSRLIVVSNRVPDPQAGRTRAGGLAVALEQALKLRGGIWLGWSGEAVDDPSIEPKITEVGAVAYARLDLTPEEVQEYYNGFSNRVLWPLMHTRLDLTEFARNELAAYLAVNRRFAQAIAALLRDDDLVWIHDYHMIPLAAELRRLGVKNRIGYFHHIPWPAPDILTALPRHDDLVKALLEYDLVGLQTEADADNLFAYLTREYGLRSNGRGVVGWDDRSCRVAHFPIGIETEPFAKRARRAGRASFVREITESLMGRKMIIGVDRLDYSKGVPERMAAFEKLIELDPDLVNKVTYLQITPRSRSEVPEYAQIERAVSETAGRVNGRFGEANWTPIRYVNRAYGRTALAGLYRAADVGLVTPFRDGMNLVAKEYVAAQNPDNPGVLVLSRFAGAAAELEGAVLVNPYDCEGMARSIAKALNMPLEERLARWRINWERLVDNSIDVWAETFLVALEDSQLSFAGRLLGFMKSSDQRFGHSHRR